MGKKERFYQFGSLVLLGILVVLVFVSYAKILTSNYSVEIENILEESITSDENMIVKIRGLRYNDIETIVTLEIASKKIQKNGSEKLLVLYDENDDILASQSFYFDQSSKDYVTYEVIINGIFPNVDHVKVESK